MFAVPKRTAVGLGFGRRPASRPGAISRQRLARATVLSLLALVSTIHCQPADIEIPYSSVFRQSVGPVYLPAKDFRWGTDPVLRFGDGVIQFPTADLSLGLNSSIDTPFHLSPPPQDAMFRFWNIYLDIPSSSIELIASDNANQTKHDREKGVIAAVTTDFDITVQLGERLQLTASGSYIYLPFESTGGFQGNSLFGEGLGTDADIDADIDTDLFLAAVFDGTIGDWSYQFYDRVGIENRDTSLTSYSGLNYDARLHYLAMGDFDKADRLGRYSLGGGHGRNRYESSRDDFDDDYDTPSDSRWEYHTGTKYNLFAVTFARDLPTDTHMALTLFRNDTWDTDDNHDDDHEWTHGVNLSLRNQHYNMRFKPYFTYTTSTSNNSRGRDGAWSHVARIGFSGPITGYTGIDANVGRTWETGSNASDFYSTLWHVSVHNELNELTTHRLSYSRSVEEPNDEIHTTLAYSIHRILGPRLTGSLFATWTEQDESNGGGDGRDETFYDVGANLNWDVSSRLTLRLTAFLAAVQEEDTDSDYEEYHIRLSADYTMTDTVSLHLSCEHIRRDQEIRDRSYRENVARARITKQW